MPSVHDTIVAATRTKLLTLTGEPTIEVRDELVRLEGDTLPLILLKRGGERPGPYHFGSQDHEYEVEGAVYSTQNHVLLTGHGEAVSWREAIRNRVMPDPSAASPLPILPGAPTVWDVDFYNLPGDSPRAKAAGYEVSYFGILFRSNEAIFA